MSGGGTTPLRCDMKHECTEPIAYIDDKGFIYCAPHGVARKYWRRCRKLRPHELRKLTRGEPLATY
jgi:hypothetical protein